MNIINQKTKLPFLFDQKNNKEEIQLQLTKLDGKPPETERQKIEKSAIFSSKNE